MEDLKEHLELVRLVTLVSICMASGVDPMIILYTPKT